MILNFIVLSLVGLSLSSCLKTRGDVFDNERSQVVQKGQSAADEVNRADEINETLRDLNGRIENLENQLQNSNKNNEKLKTEKDLTIQELDRKTQLLQEELTKTETVIAQLQAELMQIKSNQAMASTAAAANSSKTEKKSTSETYNQAEDMFRQKDWKKAILTYQKYRDDNPKGKMLPEATYKIGVSFQELGMKDEAKTFYEEVIAKFSKSEMAKKAKFRLDQIKK